MGNNVTRTTARRTIREVLADRAGAGIADGLGNAVLIVTTLALVTGGLMSAMGGVTAIATKAERQAAVAAVVGDKYAGAAWGTKSAPTTTTTTLTNGAQVRVTAWREVGETSTRLTAVTNATEGNGANCTGPSSTAKSGCVYASRLHANELDTLEPQSMIRKDPSTASKPVGTVHSRVSTTNAIPQGTEVASGSDASTAIWRYLINARSAEASGEVRVTQGGKTLAQFPVESTSGNYFGTFSAQGGEPVRISVSSGNVIVQTVYVYRAGSTS